MARNTVQGANAAAGGMLTSLVPPPGAPSPTLWGPDRRPSRVRIEEEEGGRATVPQFAGCPDWVKPLLFAEFQVPPKPPPPRLVHFSLVHFSLQIQTNHFNNLRYIVLPATFLTPPSDPLVRAPHFLIGAHTPC